MSTKRALASLLQTAAMSAAVLVIAAAGAIAQQQSYHAGENNDFGAQQDRTVRAASAAPPAAPLSAAQHRVLEDAFQAGRDTTFGAGLAQQPVLAQRDVPSRFASRLPMVEGKLDVVGGGGHQDDVAREIYTPGRGTFFDR